MEMIKRIPSATRRKLLYSSSLINSGLMFRTNALLIQNLLSSLFTLQPSE
jgi:hypothetical protein